MFSYIKKLLKTRETNLPKPISNKKLQEEWHNHRVKQLNSNLGFRNSPLGVKTDIYHRALGSQSYSSKKLEGNSCINSTASMLVDIKQLADSDPENEFARAFPLFEDAYEFAVDYQTATTIDDQDIKSYAETNFIEKITEKLSTLQNEGDKLLLPVWQKGHAILMEVTARRTDETLTWNWKVYNTGLWSDIYHLSNTPLLGGILPGAKFQTFEIGNINPKEVPRNLLRDLFFQEQRTKGKFSLRKMIQYITDKLNITSTVYRHLKLSLIRDAGGQFIKHKKADKPSHYHKTQQSGICSRKMYTLWMKENLAEQNYKLFKVHTAEQALTDLNRIPLLEEFSKKSFEDQKAQIQSQGKEIGTLLKDVKDPALLKYINDVAQEISKLKNPSERLLLQTDAIDYLTRYKNLPAGSELNDKTIKVIPAYKKATFKIPSYFKADWYRLKKNDDIETLRFFCQRALNRRTLKQQQTNARSKKIADCWNHVSKF